MLPVFWFVLVLVGICLFLLMFLPWALKIYSEYRGARAVTCPETRQQVAVRINALYAAVGLVTGTPDLHLEACTRWPERLNCNQGCIPEAQRTAPYTRGEVKLSTKKKIYHLPVIAAGFLGWVMGALLHSQHLLRSRWADALGLEPASVTRVVWWWSPHLLSVAICLLFAYGVGCLLARRGKKGTWQGIVTAVLFWFLIAATSLLASGATGLPRDVLRIDLAYTFVASIVVGAIIGGSSGKLTQAVLRD